MSRKALHLVLAARFFVLAVASFLIWSPPHIHRQSDTLGVALRYWSRWTKEPASRLPLAPAVLNSGDNEGILATEFPALNLVTAPFFALGIRAGYTASRLFVCLLVLFLVLANSHAWKGVRLSGIDAERAMLLLPLFSFSAFYAGHFMTDFIAVLLVTFAVGASWDRDRPFASYFLCALGLLLKPTSVTVLALLLVDRGWPKRWRWIVPALATALLYYTLGTGWLSAFHSTPWVTYATKMQPIRENLYHFFASPAKLENLFRRKLFFNCGFYLCAAAFLFRRLKGARLPGESLWLVLALQITATAALGGWPTYIHEYYFLGVTPTVCLILLSVWDNLTHIVPRLLIGILFGFTLAQISWHDVNVFTPSLTEELWELHQDCRSLKSSHPEFPWGRGLAFRSPVELYPELGLCFGERSCSSTAEFGFAEAGAEIPTGCSIVDRTRRVSLLRCAAESKH